MDARCISYPHNRYLLDTWLEMGFKGRIDAGHDPELTWWFRSAMKSLLSRAYIDRMIGSKKVYYSIEHPVLRRLRNEPLW